MAHPKTPPRTARIDVKGYLTSAVIVGDGIARNLLDRLTKRPSNIPGTRKEKKAWPHKRPSERPMTLRNMRQLGVRGLLVSCLNHACRHEIVICVDRYADDIEVPFFRSCMKCGRCGSVDVDVRPNWKEQPARFRGFAAR